MRFKEGEPSPALSRCSRARDHQLSYHTCPMGHDSGDGPPATATDKRSALSADEVRAFADRALRCKVSLQVLCTVPGDRDDSQMLEGELINISSSGMLLASKDALQLGAVVDFEFKLDD